MKSVFQFLPARLVDGKSWYILIYQTPPGKKELKRVRLSFNLNRIRSLTEREKRGNLIVRALNERLLPLGYPYLSEPVAVKELSKAIAELQQEEDDVLGKTPLLDAFSYAVDIKATSDRAQSNKGYLSIRRIFSAWVRQKKLENLSIKDFNRKYAMEFMDYFLIERRVKNITYNNYLQRMKLIFKELCLREYIEVSPFVYIPNRRKEEKDRRNFNHKETQLIIDHVWENDYWFSIAIFLLYIGFIRPSEVRRLKFGHFNLGEGKIHLPVSVTKSKISRVVTIPRHLLPVFFINEFTKWPANYYLFGENMTPHPTKQCGERSLNAKHRRILKKLKISGRLEDFGGLTFYSWKDTGMTDASDEMNIKDVQMQAGHKSIVDTMRYIHPHTQNKGMENYKIKFFENGKIVAIPRL